MEYGRNLKGERIPLPCLCRAPALGLALETVTVPGIGRATGYAGRESIDRIELGSRVLGWRAGYVTP